MCNDYMYYVYCSYSVDVTRFSLLHGHLHGHLPDMRLLCQMHRMHGDSWEPHLNGIDCTSEIHQLYLPVESDS